MGDGSTINVWTNPWIPSLKNQLLPHLKQPLSSLILAIQNLCYWNSGWKWDKHKLESIWGPNIVKFTYSLKSHIIDSVVWLGFG